MQEYNYYLIWYTVTETPEFLHCTIIQQWDSTQRIRFRGKWYQYNVLFEEIGYPWNTELQSQRRRDPRVYVATHAHSRPERLWQNCTAVVQQKMQTVIEALKAMSSGTMPPSSEGGKRFIHDPKIEGAPETKASIKLMFHSVDKKEILAMRTYRVTQRVGNRLEFRKLDQIMKYVDDYGKEHSVSNSCIDMDSQMAKLFGVSKAVLQNVIFCHQEETLWPFADQAHLKKIFDEIFDTEKYTKILMELRQEAKNYKMQKRLLATEFEIRSKDYQIYKGIIKTLEESREKYKNIEKSASDLAAELEEKNSSLKEYEAKEQKSQELDKEIHILQHQAKDLRLQFQKISTSPLYKDFGKKREELAQMLEELDKAKDEIAAEREKLEAEGKEIKKAIRAIETEIITIRVNRKRAEEILSEEAKLAAEYALMLQKKELQEFTGTELKSIGEVISKLEAYLNSKKAANMKEELELSDGKNQATVALKLRVEEQRQLKAILEEKERELNGLPEAMEIDAKFEEVKEKLRKYGETSEDNVKFFDECERKIVESEKKKENLVHALKAIALKDANGLKLLQEEIIKKLEAVKDEVESVDLETAHKVLRGKVQVMNKQLADARTEMRECVLKTSQFALSGEVNPELASYVARIQQLDSTISILEPKLATFESLLLDLSVLTSSASPVDACKDLDKELEVLSCQIAGHRKNYSDHLRSFIHLVHEYITLNATHNSGTANATSSQRATLQDTIRGINTKLNKIASEIEIKEEVLKSYDMPYQKLEQAKQKNTELESILNLLKDLLLRYNWTQHKKSEVSSAEGNYEEIEGKKETEKTELLKRQDQITEELRNGDRVLGDRQLLQSQIEMNITKYDIQKSVKGIKADYEQKEQEKLKTISELEGKKILLEEIKVLSGKYHELLGEARNLAKTIQSQERELLTPQYKNIEGTIQFLQFQMLTADKLSEAILARHDAIEESVMMYHNKKMEQINKEIKDLWKLTYKGKDIETIEIKSDIDKAGSRYHSFNYRIVFKNVDGTELDMRGRCSAGQKVLGSLLIRLALAEAFCADCGVLALDEPTTNLDTENITGLAEALTDIINERAGHKNFQLIVISHDEPFIQALGGKFTEHIWKVEKNEYGYSTLKKAELKEVFQQLM
eukprot:TRINITY_DN1216_c1_g1_i4.p1 TRINITY_DN1216_c1_g1~~TRINITY_DN1216_c1_g1_i4.p1  ORF type:complete len:1142 (+),score=175.87 TRINITY_DN1216_c1_g1_i4:8199-11624(+)